MEKGIVAIICNTHFTGKLVSSAGLELRKIQYFPHIRILFYIYLSPAHRFCQSYTPVLFGFIKLQ